ncbi:MAG TPA: hypothetical protein PJ982_11055 [Lacipirellulaceae bacterium]|nr:hypothetical protein [Lacipirellulaceae bacterium]
MAVSLVRDERTTLALARRRDVTSLLVAVADAVASTEGHVVIEHLTATRDPSAPPDAIDPGGRLLLDVSSTEGYDISLLARALERPPLKSVKIVRSEAVAGAETPHNHHILECQY